MCSSDLDAAFEWFKDRANGGDIVVIRADRIGGYNPHIHSETGGGQADSVATHRLTPRGGTGGGRMRVQISDLCIRAS